MRRALVAAAVAPLCVAGTAAAAPPRSQDVVLPGPVPYPTQSPPLVGKTSVGGAFTRYVFRIASDERVLVGVDDFGSPSSVRVRQRLGVRGRGDYQFVISAPIEDVRPGPGTQSDPGLRADQVLWAGFSPGRKVLSADATLRAADAVQYLPLRLQLARTGGGVTLTATNATVTPETEYTGIVHAPQIARLLDRTRRSARAGERLAAAYATFDGLVRQRTQKTPIEAPLHVEGELRVGDSAPPARFSRTLGDGSPLTLRVHATGNGKPHLALTAVPVPVERLLQPPGGAPTWTTAVRRKKLPAPFLLRRLIQSRMRLVRSDQYRTFLSNPDADGRSRTVYVYESAAAPKPAAAPAAPKENGGDALVLLLAIGGSVLVAGFALVAWAHS